LASVYRIHGVTFWESAKTLSEKIGVDDVGVPKRVTAIPFYFLASHAAELLLKSALLKRGFSEHELKQFSYRHSLQGLLDALQKKGVSVTPATTAIVSGLHDQHSTHALRYTSLVDDGQSTYMMAIPRRLERGCCLMNGTTVRLKPDTTYEHFPRSRRSQR
jgi:hypothetical protein